MLEIRTTVRFKKDIKIAQRRGFDITILTDVIRTISKKEVLNEKQLDHSLKGNWGNFRECHIAPDWLLIYQINEDAQILILTRTGTHSDLY